LIQANWVGRRLAEAEPDLSVELLTVKTRGDKIQDVPLAQVGGKGLFVKEIEEALLAGRAHLAVHSVKDIPTDLPAGLHLAAVPRRENPRDALISREGQGLDELAVGATVGTSSLRRTAQLLARRPDLAVKPLRGNVETRLRKIEERQVDAIILAAAGLARLGLSARVTELFEPAVMLPAVGQGALGLECRIEDGPTNELVSRINDQKSLTEIRAERAFLARLDGGCQVPIAALARLEEGRLSLEGLVAGLGGEPLIRRRITGPAPEAEELGRRLAEEILAQGGAAILAEVYGK